MFIVTQTDSSSYFWPISELCNKAYYFQKRG